MSKDKIVIERRGVFGSGVRIEVVGKDQIDRYEKELEGSAKESEAAFEIRMRQYRTVIKLMGVLVLIAILIVLVVNGVQLLFGGI